MSVLDPFPHLTGFLPDEVYILQRTHNSWLHLYSSFPYALVANSSALSFPLRVLVPAETWSSICYSGNWMKNSCLGGLCLFLSFSGLCICLIVVHLVENCWRVLVFMAFGCSVNEMLPSSFQLYAPLSSLYFLLRPLGSSPAPWPWREPVSLTPDLSLLKRSRAKHLRQQ